MDKSLLERIGENTRKVMAERAAEERQQNKSLVLQNLTNVIRQKANCGQPLLAPTASVLVYEFTVCVEEVTSPISRRNAMEALTDIGFTFEVYPMCTRLSVPRKCVSAEIRILMEEHKKLLNAFTKAEQAKAKVDCGAVIKKLERGEYEVIGFDRVLVTILPASKSEQYMDCAQATMKQNGFEVIHFEAREWDISIIQEEGD